MDGTDLEHSKEEAQGDWRERPWGLECHSMCLHFFEAAVCARCCTAATAPMLHSLLDNLPHQALLWAPKACTLTLSAPLLHASSATIAIIVNQSLSVLLTPAAMPHGPPPCAPHLARHIAGGSCVYTAPAPASAPASAPTCTHAQARTRASKGWVRAGQEQRPPPAPPPCTRTQTAQARGSGWVIRAPHTAHTLCVHPLIRRGVAHEQPPARWPEVVGDA